jgi:hypothetical protein
MIQSNILNDHEYVGLRISGQIYLWKWICHYSANLRIYHFWPQFIVTILGGTSNLFDQIRFFVCGNGQCSPALTKSYRKSNDLKIPSICRCAVSFGDTKIKKPEQGSRLCWMFWLRGVSFRDECCMLSCIL